MTGGTSEPHPVASRRRPPFHDQSVGAAPPTSARTSTCGGQCCQTRKDDFVLELAVESGCDYIVTFNTGDFAGAGKFGVLAVRPQELFRELRERYHEHGRGSDAGLADEADS